MELTSFKSLLVSRKGAIVAATIHRPDRRNSIDEELLRELSQLLDDAESEDGVRVVVIEGENGLFCSGMDLEDASGGPAADRFMQLLSRLASVPLITVAKVDGSALGGGVGIAAACDLVVATPRSQFGLPEALWGMLPCCVLPYLIRRTGVQPAYRMALTTRNITASEGLAIHLVDEVSETPDEAIRQLVLRSTRIDPSTIADLKRFVRTNWIIDDSCEQDAVREITRLAALESVRERIESFRKHQSRGGDE